MSDRSPTVRRAEPSPQRVANINLQALEAFCEVVRLQSFSRGAAAVGISQSAASQLVAHLETELGIQLIDRRRRPLAPTAEGRAYYLGCQQLLHRHRTLVDDIRRGEETLSGTVRVASIYSVGLHTLSRYLQNFMAKYLGVRVQLEYLHPVKVYSAVLNDEADIGVVSYPSPHRQLEVTSWLEEQMVVACPQTHRLASRRTMRLGELEGERFVAFDPDLKIRREIDRALRNIQVTVEIASEFDNIETIKQALEISQAVSILPRPSIRREVERKTLVEIALDDIQLTRPVGIIAKRRRKMTRTTQLFVENLLEAAPAGAE